MTKRTFIGISTDGSWDTDLEAKFGVKCGTDTKIALMADTMKTIKFPVNVTGIFMRDGKFIFVFGSNGGSYGTRTLSTPTYCIPKSEGCMKEFREKYLANTKYGRVKIEVIVDNEKCQIICTDNFEEKHC